MRIRILGCGTSTGVPRIGSGWGRCDPHEPRNRRMRSSIVVESGGQRLLVDCGPDLRQQALDAGLDRIDGVLVTHDHADHCHGIDDLRPFAQQIEKPVPLYARSTVIDRLQGRFAYVFTGSKFYPAVAEAIELGPTMDLGNAELRFVDQPHGKITSVGIRLDEGGRSAVYATDFNDMTDEMRALYEQADVWICDCLMLKPHPTHAHLDAVLGWARELNVGQLFLTHLSNAMDYRTLVQQLPDWAAPAHDGLEIAL